MFAVSGGKLVRKWRSKDHSVVESPVIHKGGLLLSGVKRLDLHAGTRSWRGGARGTFLVTGDDRIIACGRDGLVLLEASPPGGEAKKLSQVGGVPHGWPSVALGNGVIFCRGNKGTLAAYGVRGGR